MPREKGKRSGKNQGKHHICTRLSADGTNVKRGKDQEKIKENTTFAHDYQLMPREKRKRLRKK